VKRIRQFTADASHELRTPLALIRSTAELALRREREPEEYRKSLRAIENVAEQMTALTEDLLTVARADAHGFAMALGPVDLTALVNGVVEQSVTTVLAVKDTGEGIPASELPHIFERFYRGDPARGSGSGFGLGLSIAQAIAQAHGSRIVAESQPGAGARFSLQLKL